MAYRKYILWILLLAPMIGQAEIYRWVDENGKTVYSDRPRQGATKIDLPPLTTYKPQAGSESGGASGTEAPPPEKKSFYKTMSIATPGNEQTFTDNTGRVIVNIALSPALRASDEIRFQLDDEVVIVRSQSHTYENVYRGSHTVNASVVDASGNTLISANPVVFYVQRHSVLKKKPKPPSP